MPFNVARIAYKRLDHSSEGRGGSNSGREARLQICKPGSKREKYAERFLTGAPSYLVAVNVEYLNILAFQYSRISNFQNIRQRYLSLNYRKDHRCAWGMLKAAA